MSAGGGGGASSGIGAVGAGGTDPESHYGHDGVKVYSHEGEGENTEHLNSMDLHDVKSELERDAEKAETPRNVPTSSGSAASSATTSVNSAAAQIRSVISPPMVYNGVAAPFVMPPFATAGTPLYNVAGLRPVKMEAADWKVSQGQMTAIPAYSYPGIVSGLPVDQSGLRPAYPFMIPGQYVQVPYHPQISALGNPVAPNASVQPSSGIITPTMKEKKPHIKKPLNAFMLFMKEKRAEVIKQCTLKESAAINQILGKMWHKLDRSEQAKYYELAREERARHMQMYPGWSARDNYAVHKKRKRKQKKQTQPEEEEETDPAHPPLSPDPNSRKCRARYGLDQQQMWCGPCRRKKKCIRCSEGDGDNAPRPDETPLEDDVMTRDDKNVSSEPTNGEIPNASTTFGALATGQANDCSNITQSDSTAVTSPPVSLSSQVAAT